MEITVFDNEIQPAIDRAYASGGGRVSLAPGVHACATIYLRSNVELHLEEGSVISGSTNPDDYDDFSPKGLLASPEDSKKCIIACENSENVSVTGHGIINGNGLAFFDTKLAPGAHMFQKPSWPRPRIMQLYRCRNVLIEGVTMLDAPGWTFWMSNCQDVMVRNVKIHGDQRMINNDGIDVDSCQNVTIQDTDFRTGDDCIAVRAIRFDKSKPSVCSNLVVHDCCLDSACSGIRIGCPSDDTIRDCHFSRLSIKGHGHGIRCEAPYHYLRMGCKGYLYTDNLTFEDIDIECGNSPIKMFVSPSIELRRFGGFAFRHVRFNACLPVTLLGTASTNLVDVELVDVEGIVKGKSPLCATFTRNLKLSNFSVTSVTGEKDDGIIPVERGKSWETKF
ncbi:MAG: right-handed parallel beta-helix repeat-containing protein [Victivallales bacterium]|nr:right-handed parallel beta-helix repeat-containing protein [Victivallales bacterium]